MPKTQDTWLQSLNLDDPLKKEWQPTAVFLAGNSIILREIPWTEAPGSRKELDMTEHVCACSKEKEAIIPSFVCNNVFNF